MGRAKDAEDTVNMLAAAELGEKFVITRQVGLETLETFYVKRISQEEYESDEGYGPQVAR